ncbi:type II toxin-antitoxin system Phd/YefM family antitoxin [Desulfobacter postgatei]|jgi:antitoxin (DNA-binding transcriptional repressor) of toxin-antitoxin stability system|uniref:type II toxin-antitoxin system Phd/YefM family antitoxin n=1 Tax=Desulfobacter postgatei TaxID=2293 RepID=UPI002A371F62|nr:type II toxin-antitoxin system Phd/YefM family antitoxin [Desulfobacter postgatei]MDX9963694.1 type II toxin-antitoxin system Phd/YefM family antitoxin [Desulfobacter postgatei]
MIRQTINIAKINIPLAKFIEDIDTGSEIILTKGGKPVAKLSKFKEANTNIRFGVLKGKVKISDDFDAPLPESILTEFEG